MSSSLKTPSVKWCWPDSQRDTSCCCCCLNFKCECLRHIKPQLDPVALSSIRDPQWRIGHISLVQRGSGGDNALWTLLVLKNVNVPPDIGGTFREIVKVSISPVWEYFNITWRGVVWDKGLTQIHGQLQSLKWWNLLGSMTSPQNWARALGTSANE